ncbi:cytochrome-c oxidase, subunit VIIa [Durotheca rogersii]|uniref:cytochrome-c oxidase, subunit VIIa n=1 Tax=Durotheca rogersii TaxID=419775 RepID=UPI00221FC6EA|nr:cytochrome-c oxidase, subunit VIIa [Durotheca rogersii]KAI5860817.1 cytochrome-c oxidase, subunit VIIa [Durotheca rogersii]
MAIKPITGMLRRGLITDISVALGLGVTFGTLFWHGFHMPRTHARDAFYRKLEADRAARAV